MVSKSAYDKIIAGTPASAFSTQGCLYPKRRFVYDSLVGEKRPLDLVCGKCINCSTDARNQWVTRMCLHSLYYKHCYFVTLTYGTYNLHPFVKHPFKEDWLATFPVLDNHNSTGRLCYTPSILRKEHLTKFIKRLRHLCKSPISYAACGEYGSSAYNHETGKNDGYGRPHFHLIVWTDDALTRQDFESAWSFDLVRIDSKQFVQYNGKNDVGRKRFRFPIGRVDFNDLVANGSLNFKGTYDGQSLTGQHCFNYVAKYVAKSSELNRYVMERTYLAYLKLPFSRASNDRDDIGRYDWNTLSLDGWVREFTKRKAPLYWEKYRESYIFREITYNNKLYEKIDLSKFREIVSPFFVTSRLHCIGKEYALENLDRFCRGNYDLPKFQDRELVFPTYFAKLAQLKQYPLRFPTKSSLGNSLVMGCLPYVYNYYSGLRDDKSYYSASSFYTSYTRKVFGSAVNTVNPRKGLLHHVTFHDPTGYINYFYNPNEDIFEGYRFDRSCREYVFVDYMDRISFCDYVLDLICDIWETLDNRRDSRERMLKIYDAIRADKDTPNIIESYLDLKKYTQDKYISRQGDKSDLQ